MLDESLKPSKEYESGHAEDKESVQNPDIALGHPNLTEVALRAHKAPCL